MNFFDIFFEKCFDKCFDERFDNFFMSFLKDLLTHSLLSIGSFKIGVLLISPLHFRLLQSGLKGLQCAQEALFPFF